MRVMPGGVLLHPRAEAEERPLPSHVPAGQHGGEEPSSQDVRQASVRINLALQSISTKLQFVVDEGAGRTIVQVIDGDTSQVIRQIPSVETLVIAKSLDRLEGILLHQKA